MRRLVRLFTVMTTQSNSDMTLLSPLSIPPPLECEGYRKLLASVKRDEESGDKWHKYRDKLAWVVARARHYAEKTGLRAEDILDAWEDRRDYWYMNYYQESRQPEIKGNNVRVFETVADLSASVGKAGFRCPHCNEVSKSPYACDSGVMMDGKACDWKVYGLFGHMGKGVSVFVKEKVAGESLFMPVAWESFSPENDQTLPTEGGEKKR